MGCVKGYSRAAHHDVSDCRTVLSRGLTSGDIGRCVKSFADLEDLFASFQKIPVDVLPAAPDEDTTTSV